MIQRFCQNNMMCLKKGFLIGILFIMRFLKELFSSKVNNVYKIHLKN